MKIVWLPNFDIKLLTFFDKNTKNISWLVYVNGFNLNNYPLIVGGESPIFKIMASDWIGACTKSTQRVKYLVLKQNS